MQAVCSTSSVKGMSLSRQTVRRSAVKAARPAGMFKYLKGNITIPVQVGITVRKRVNREDELVCGGHNNTEVDLVVLICPQFVSTVLVHNYLKGETRHSSYFCLFSWTAVSFFL